MSVLRGRPPGLAGGIIGTSRAYCSSLRACPAPKSPTKARLSAVHMTCLQQGSPLLNADPASVCPSAHPSRIGFSNGLLACTGGLLEHRAGEVGRGLSAHLGGHLFEPLLIVPSNAVGIKVVRVRFA